MREQPICANCKQPILEGSYVTALGKTWHREHFLCAACGLPILENSFNVHEGKPYHPACYVERFVPKCAYCGQPLVGEYLIDFWGNKFHKIHQTEFPRCIHCGRLVPLQQQESGLKPGAVIRCPVCRAEAIETSNEAQPIFRQLIQWVGQQGLRYNSLPITLELVDRPKLAEYLHVPMSVEPRELGVTMSTTYLEDGRAVRTEIKRVLVLQGMPSVLFQGVTIHELGHVWLTVQGIEKLPLWAEEGFCELLSQRYLSEIKTEEGRFYRERIEKNTDAIYGDGFRRVKAVVDRIGFQRFIQVLQTTKQMPT